MPHLNEADGFDAATRDYLRDLFPGAEMAYQVRLPKSDRVADFITTRELPGSTPNVVYVTETEDDFEGVITSVGQVEMYAGHFDRGIPILTYPEGHAEHPELEALRRTTPVTLLEVPAEYQPGADDAAENGGENA